MPLLGVPPQLGRIEEARSALVARVRLARHRWHGAVGVESAVGVQSRDVRIERALLRESRVTLTTLKRPLARVHSLVRLEIALESESAMTANVRALVGPLAAVNRLAVLSVSVKTRNILRDANCFATLNQARRGFLSTEGRGVPDKSTFAPPPGATVPQPGRVGRQFIFVLS